MGAFLARYRLPYGFLLPTALVIGVVVLYPFLYNLYISITNMGLYHATDFSVIGLGNYQNIFKESELYSVLGKTVIWTVVNVFFHVTLGILFALLLDGPVRGKPIFRALLILPWAMPQYIVALTWRGMFSYEYGAINLILNRWFGIDPVPWLSDPFWAFSAATITNIWLGFPFMMVIALGGLQSIPKELYEAAEIDGANAWQRFWRITLPMLKPVMVPAVSLGAIWTFNNLNVIWLVTRGGEPADSSHILVTYVYKAAFTYYRYGYAAAFSVVIFLILLGFILGYLKQTKALDEGGGEMRTLRSVIFHLILAGVTLATIYPILVVISVSLRPSDALYSTSLSLIPDGATLAAYKTILTEKPFLLWMRNSLIVSVSVTIFGVALASTAGYAFSRFRFPGRKAGMIALLITQMFPATMLLLPLYVLMRNLGLIDSLVGLIIAYTATVLPFTVWTLKGYYDTIPRDLEEAAMVDGTNQVGAFLRVVLPLARPALMITALFSFMSGWSEFIVARVILSSQTLYTLPLGLEGLAGTFQTEWANYSAGSLLVCLPVVVLFLTLNRFLVSGLTLGGVKG